MTDLMPSTKPTQTGSESISLKLETFLPYQLSICSNLVTNALSRIYGERYNIGVPEWRVMVMLGEFETLTAKAIGIRTHMHKTKVSRAVALLERRKLVTRRANHADLREAFLSLTPAGREMYEDLAPSALEFTDKMMDAFDPADRATFIKALGNLMKRAESVTDNIAKERNSG